MEKIKITKDKSHLGLLPANSGVYLFQSENGKVIYVGKARNLKNRVTSYFTGNKTEKINLLLNEASDLCYILVNNEFDALILEANLVQKLQPKFNVELKDNKSYPYIKITKETIPQVLIVRKILDDKAYYFGPYPDSSAVYDLVKVFRKTFGFCTHHKPYSSCLYVHLGLCPFPYEKIKRKDYLKNINYIRQILAGKRELIERKLQKELNEVIQRENFEQASDLNKKILQLRNLTQKSIEANSYINDPLVLNKKRTEELNTLVELLNKYGMEIKTAKRIECFDVSNIMGNQPAASMVVLTDGEPDKKEYKRFKIKYVRGINDFLMIKEAVKRRLNHPEWGKPDLILIDGGFGQLKYAQEAVFEARQDLPLIGLAKRQEQICLPNGKLLTISTQNPAIHVLQRVRDEAHRFAKKYHNLLRMKHFQTMLNKK